MGKSQQATGNEKALAAVVGWPARAFMLGVNEVACPVSPQPEPGYRKFPRGDRPRQELWPVAPIRIHSYCKEQLGMEKVRVVETILVRAPRWSFDRRGRFGAQVKRAALRVA